MAETDAIILENYVPNDRGVALRPGYESHATGMGDQVESIMPYTGPVTTKIIAAANGELWDATSSGAASSLDTGLTSNRWQHCMFGTAAGNYLLMVNGEDVYRYYDGSIFTEPTLVGVAEEDLIHVNIYKQRVFFVEKESLSLWYLAAASISGTATEYNVAPYVRRGGYLVASATWTVDGGNGSDDYLVAITSEGEAAVFTGTDPSSSSSWALVGVFRTGKPLGRRCFEKWGGELILVTEDGYMPISAFLSGKGAAGSISDKIRNAVTNTVRSYKSNFGWQPIFIPSLNLMIFNVPQNAGGSQAEQHVLNTITGSWCRFTDIDATCWADYAESAYFGGNGVIYRLDSLISSDNDNAILTDVKPAFSYMRANSQKSFKMIRPMFITNGTISPVIDMNVDFSSEEPFGVTTASNDSLTYWDASPWDTSSWGGSETVQRDWLGASGVGYVGTMRMKASTKNINYAIQAIDYMYESGGYL